jgi:hypothetical protein
VNTRLSIVTSVGVFSAALVGLMPACGSDSNNGNNGRLLEGGVGGTGGSKNTGTGGTPSTATGGAGGGAAGNGTVTPTTPIGQTCLKDSDCGTMGLKCLLPSGTEFLGGGVPNGVCTLDCSADINSVSPSAISACAKVDSSATCLQVSATQGFCWELCTIGPVPSTEIKCHNRRDMGCYDPDGIGMGYCKPSCRGDFDCGTRKCDLSEGICVDSIPADRKLPLGSKCDPQLTNDPCQGRCIGVSSSDSGALADVGFCSGLCKIGEIACGVDPTSKTNIAADCLFAPDQNADLGDLGFCAQLCDCNDNCQDPDFICSSLPSQLVSQIGRKGACNPKEGANSGEPNGIKCTTTTKPPVVVDSGKPPTKPMVDAGAPDAP